jgi:hypothetical protein
VNHAEYHSLEACGVLLLKRLALVGDRSLLGCRHEARSRGFLSVHTSPRTNLSLLRVPPGQIIEP